MLGVLSSVLSSFTLYSPYIYLYCTARSRCLKIGPVLGMNLSLKYSWSVTSNVPELSVLKTSFVKPFSSLKKINKISKLYYVKICFYLTLQDLYSKKMKTIS